MRGQMREGGAGRRHGRGVLVTGASRGVGAATARVFAERGDRVVVHYRGAQDRAREGLEDLPGEGHAMLQADLSSPGETRSLADAAAEALGRVDVLVNNAALFLDPAVGGSRRGDHRITDVDYEDWVSAWRTTLETNLLGPANLTWCIARHKLHTPAPQGAPTGRIVNVGSRGACAQSPFGRVAQAREVAEAIWTLAQPGAQWASGAVVDFNGASYLR